jgi:hypothetical protein
MRPWFLQAFQNGGLAQPAHARKANVLVFQVAPEVVKLLSAATEIFSGGGLAKHHGWAPELIQN